MTAVLVKSAEANRPLEDVSKVEVFYSFLPQFATIRFVLDLFEVLRS